MIGGLAVFEARRTRRPNSSVQGGSEQVKLLSELADAWRRLNLKQNGHLAVAVLVS
jgi:hypothetical protein